MDVIGSEIGQKMRSAIKAKLTELGCYVDDELPDYVMVMVANKRTRAQMEEDLQLFLGDNTELFVNWLHQVLKKLQEVTVAPPSQVDTIEKPHSSMKDKKDKKGKSKEKHKKADTKKGKKKDKHRKRKEDKKSHKEKKKNKHQDTIRPNIPLNIPPLLMNMEKQSEPSITDVFAGQILKNHGVNLDSSLDDLKTIDTKPIIKNAKKTHLPIIDPATISQSSEDVDSLSQNTEAASNTPKEDQIQEINEIEAKIQGLKQKLVDQLDSMSDDEDFINIRTEAEELMNDFADDVIQELSAANTESTETPPLLKSKNLPLIPNKTNPPTPQITEVLPQIELQLPKRPLRNRLGPREEPKKVTQPPKESTESPERFTPDREPIEEPLKKVSAKSRLGTFTATSHHNRRTDIFDKSESSSGRIASKVSFLERPRSGPASVVRVRPRLRPATKTPASNLLFRAVADANKSLINAPPKQDAEISTVKRAFVMPIRREIETQKIIIQVPGNRATASPSRDTSDCEIDCDTESLPDLESDSDNKNNKATIEQSEYMPISITRRFINNTDYVPTESIEHSDGQDDVFLDPITIHNAKLSRDKEKGPQFVVTLDGLDPNVFLAKKLRTEGLINDDEELKLNTARHKKSLPQKPLENDQIETVTENANKNAYGNESEKQTIETSDESETIVAIKKEKVDDTQNECEEKRQSDGDVKIEVPQMRKRKASPIVFDVEKKENAIKKDVVRQRTESASSEGHVSVSTTTSKYDSIPSLSSQEKKLQPCRSFPTCRWGADCVFQHPLCKFAAACSRRSCIYSHPTTACSKTVVSIASHVVPAPNYKSISTVVLPGMCKFYPNCANPGCHYFHPKACRYGKACLNKLECNFYHHDVQSSSSLKWRSANV